MKVPRSQEPAAEKRVLKTPVVLCRCLPSGSWFLCPVLVSWFAVLVRSWLGSVSYCGGSHVGYVFQDVSGSSLFFVVPTC